MHVARLRLLRCAYTAHHTNTGVKGHHRLHATLGRQSHQDRAPSSKLAVCQDCHSRSQRRPQGQQRLYLLRWAASHTPGWCAVCKGDS